MHRPILESLVRSCMSVAASVVLISSAGVTPANAAESFTPTMKDMLSIQGAIERYERGMDTGDVKLQESAFWDDAVMIGPQGKRPAKQAGRGRAELGRGGPPGAGGPPARVDLRRGPCSRWTSRRRWTSGGGPPGGHGGLPARPPSCDSTYKKPANRLETLAHRGELIVRVSEPDPRQAPCLLVCRLPERRIGERRRHWLHRSARQLQRHSREAQW